MKNMILAILLASGLAACSATGAGSGSSQMYGEIKGGVESGRSF